MEKLTTQAEIVNEFEEAEMFCAPGEPEDTPRPGDGDEPVEPIVPKPKDPDEDEEVIKPGTF